MKPSVSKNSLSPTDITDSKKIDSDSEVEEMRTTDEDEDYTEVIVSLAFSISLFYNKLILLNMTMILYIH